MDLNIIYEDSQIIIVEKPSGIPSQMDKTGDKDMLTYIKQYIKQKDIKASNPYVGLIHRLDRPVGGVMIFAKTKQANVELSNQIANRKLEKKYIAVVCGKSDIKHEKLVNYLLKNERLNTSKVVEQAVKNAKQAILEYDILDTIYTQQFGQLSLLRLNLYTGRHHQIRVQLSNHGLPLWGDTKYNEAFSKTHSWWQIALWAESLVFKYPVKTKNIYKITLIPKNQYPFTEFSNYMESLSDIKPVFITK